MKRNVCVAMFVTFLLGCAQMSKIQRNVDGGMGHIFPKDYTPTLVSLDGARERYTPTHQDIEKAEEILNAQLEGINIPLAEQGMKGCPIIHTNLHRYRRQYIGYVDYDGNKVVWVNFIIKKDKESLKNLDKEVIVVLDGCSQYWNIKVNIDKSKLYDLRVNGTA